MLEWLKQLMTDNQFLSGGAMLVVLGYMAYHLKAMPYRAMTLFQRTCLIHCDIQDRDSAYAWVAEWLSKHPSTAKNSRVSVVTKWGFLTVNDAPSAPSARIGATETDSRPGIHLIPAPGFHFIRWRGCWFLIYRERSKESGGGGGGLGAMKQRPKESFAIWAMRFNRKVLLDMLHDARDVAHPKDDDHVSVYVASGDWWRQAHAISSREADSVILADDGVQEIIEDIRKFLSLREWYSERGIPWRRGWLLEGPPGNGKTSVIKAVATALKRNLGVINLSDERLEDTSLSNLMHVASEHTIIVLEDTDCAMAARIREPVKEYEEGQGPGSGQSSDSQQPAAGFMGSRLSTSGLLNAIDGIGSADGRIMFMTTNHKEKLDPALIRPGRADKHMHVGYPGPEEAKKLFHRFFPGAGDLDAELFAKKADGKTSMAALQGELLSGVRDVVPEKALNMVDVKCL